MFSTLGGTVGISMGDTIFSSELVKRLAKVSGFTSSSSSGVTSYTGLSQIQPESLRNQVLHAYTRSLATIYIVCVPLSFIGLLAGTLKLLISSWSIYLSCLCFLVLTVREYSLQRNLQRGAKDAHKDGKTFANPVDETPSPTARTSLSEKEKDSA